VKQLATFRLDADGAFFVAAVTTVLFALHPLRVESVAWVAARKDLLYSTFYVLTVIAYVAYVKAPASRQLRFYMLAVTFFLASLLSKSMAVTLPALLTLLDYYPLARLDIRRPLVYLKKDFADKLPFVVLSGVIVVVTLMTQSDAMATQIGVLDQLRNATHNIVLYLQRLIAPVGLVPFYPFPEPEVLSHLAHWLPQFLFIAAVSASSVVLAWRGKPLLLTCWFGYLAMLAPASGVIHVGSAAAADRYTYLSQLPLLVLIATITLWFWIRFVKLRRTLLVTACLSCLTLTAITYMQIGHWKNPITLWTHVLRVYPEASLAHRNLGAAYFVVGDYEKALMHIDSLAVQGWPVASQLIESLNATGRQAEGLARYQALLEESGHSSQQRKLYAEIVRLLNEQTLPK
jgi:tetratricopeptide (TPR) repeat protein